MGVITKRSFFNSSPLLCSLLLVECTLGTYIIVDVVGTSDLKWIGSRGWHQHAFPTGVKILDPALDQLTSWPLDWSFKLPLAVTY